MFEMTELLHHDACIDLNRTGMLARAVASAGLYCVIFVLLQQRFLNGRTWVMSHHLPAQCDPLARCCGQVTAWTDRFAIATFNAGVGDVLDLRESMCVLDMAKR